MNKKKHVLILGGSSDIAAEVIKNFLELRWDITAHYFKNDKKLISLRKKYKNLNLIQFDFSNYKDTQIEKKLKRKFNGKYDSIINLVGYIDNVGFENSNLKSIFRSLKANAILPILIEQQLVKKMLVNNWGRILNCSSIGVKFGGGYNSFNYALSKHCVEFIPNSYKKWATKNVLINNLRIGVTKTKLHKRMKKNISMKERIKLIPMNRMADPKEIAIYITDLSTEKNSYMTGQTLSASGGE